MKKTLKIFTTGFAAACVAVPVINLVLKKLADKIHKVTVPDDLDERLEQVKEVVDEA